MYLIHPVLQLIGALLLWASCCLGGIGLMIWAAKFSQNGTRRICRAILVTALGITAITGATALLTTL